MNGTPEDKAAFNARAKASMRRFLRSKTWKEKVDSIARMNDAGRRAKEAMQRSKISKAQTLKTDSRRRES